jgi:1-acyl-sn-glycerol-3-phosphate acyltransferase
MSGAGAVLPAGGFRVRPGTIRVRFGAPITLPAGSPAEVRDRIAVQAREAVVALMDTP